MSETMDNVARVRDFVLRVEQGGRLELIDEFVDPGFRDRTAEAGQSGDRDGLRAVMAAIHEAFSDVRIDVVHCVATDDVVATYKVIHGRHVGDWPGSPASGRPVELRVTDFLRLREGRFVEHWAVVDRLREAS